MKKILISIVLIIVIFFGYRFYQKQENLLNINEKVVQGVNSFYPEELNLNNYNEETKKLAIDNSVSRFRYYDKEKIIEYIPYHADGNTLLSGKNSFIITGADYDTFVPLLEGWAKDKNTLYQYGKNMNIPSSDAMYFYPYGYVLTPNVVYSYQNFDSGGIILPGSDPKTFSLLGREKQGDFTFFAKDKNNIYFIDKQLTGLDYNTVEFIYGNYIKDKNGWYYVNKSQFQKIDGADLQKMLWVGNNYIKDDKNIYFLDKFTAIIQTGIDYSSFIIAENPTLPQLMKDKNNYYLNGKIYTGQI